MKAYLVTTGFLFALLTVMHVLRVFAEWPKSGVSPLFVLGMTALIVLPAALAWWACVLLRRLSSQDGK